MSTTRANKEDKKKRLGSRRSKAKQNEPHQPDEINFTGSASVAQHQIPEEDTESSYASNPAKSETETQHQPLSEHTEKRRKLGSSRINKARQHVKDPETASSHEADEKPRRDEGLETRHTSWETWSEKQEDVSQVREHETSAMHSSSLHSVSVSHNSEDVDHQEGVSDISDSGKLLSTTEKGNIEGGEDADGPPADTNLLNANLMSASHERVLEVCATAEITDQTEELPADEAQCANEVAKGLNSNETLEIAEETILRAEETWPTTSDTVREDDNIPGSITGPPGVGEMPEEFSSMFSVIERDDTDLGHQAVLQANSSEGDSSIAPETTSERRSAGEHAGPECSAGPVAPSGKVSQAGNEERNEDLNLTNTVENVHVSTHLKNRAEIIDTQQCEIHKKGSDRSGAAQDGLDPDKEQESLTKDMLFQPPEHISEDYSAYDSQTPHTREAELSQVHEVNSHLEENITSFAEQTSHQQEGGLFYEGEESKSLQNLEAKIDSTSTLQTQEDPMSSEEQVADISPIGSKRKLGSRRIKKRHQQVIDSAASHHDNVEDSVEHNRINESLETTELALQTIQQEETPQETVWEIIKPVTDGSSLYSLFVPGDSAEVQKPTTTCPRSDLDPFIQASDNVQEANKENEADFTVEALNKPLDVAGGMATADSLANDAREKSEIVSVNPQTKTGTSQSELDLKGTDASAARLNSSKPDDESDPPSKQNHCDIADQEKVDCHVCETKEVQTTNTEAPDGAGLYQLPEDQVEDKEAPATQTGHQVDTERLGVHTEPGCSTEQVRRSSPPELSMSEEQDGRFFLSGARGAGPSEDAVNKAHDQGVTQPPTHEAQEATENAVVSLKAIHPDEFMATHLSYTDALDHISDYPVNDTKEPQAGDTEGSKLSATVMETMLEETDTPQTKAVSDPGEEGGISHLMRTSVQSHDDQQVTDQSNCPHESSVAESDKTDKDTDLLEQGWLLQANSCERELKAEGGELSVTPEEATEKSRPGEASEGRAEQAALSSPKKEQDESFALSEVTGHIRTANVQGKNYISVGENTSSDAQSEAHAPVESQPEDKQEGHTGFKSVEHRRKLGSSRRTKGKQQDHKEDVETTWADEGSETTDTTRQEELTQHTDPAANASELIRRYGNEGETAGNARKDDTAVPDSAMGPSVTGTTDVTKGDVLLPGVEGNKHTEVCHKPPPKDEQIMSNGATSAESVAATVEDAGKSDSIREKEATSADGSYSESDHDSRTEEKVSDPINQDHHASYEVNPEANDAENATTEGQEEDSVKGPAEQTGHLDKEAPPSVPDHRTLQPEILASADPHTQDNPGSSEEQNNKGFKSVGSRRKLGSSRRNDGKQRGENPESHQSPTEGRNTVRYEQLEASPGATQEAWDPPQAEAVHGPAEEQALVGWDGSTRPEGDQQLKDQSSSVMQIQDEEHPHVSVPDTGSRDTHQDLMRLKPEGRELQTSVTLEKGPEHSCPGEETQPERPVGQAALSSSNASTEEELSERFHLCEVTQHVDDAARKAHEEEPEIAETQAESDRASVRSQPEVQAPLVSQPLDTSHIMEKEGHTGFKSVEHRRKLGSSRRTKGKQQDHKEDVETTWADEGSETTGTTRQEELTQHTDPAANASELMRRYGNEGETAEKTRKDDTAVPDSAMGPSVTGTTDVTEGDVLLPGVEGNKHTEVCHKPPPKDEQIMSNGATSAESVAATVEDADKSDSIREKEATSADGSYSESNHDSRTEEKVSDPINQDHHASYEVNPEANDAENATTEGQEEDSVKGPAEQTGHLDKEAPPSVPDHRTLQPEILASADPHTQDNPGSSEEQNNKGFKSVGSRRKLGSSRRNDGKQRGENPESHQSPTEGRNTVRYEQLEASPGATQEAWDPPQAEAVHGPAEEQALVGWDGSTRPEGGQQLKDQSSSVMQIQDEEHPHVSVPDTGSRDTHEDLMRLKPEGRELQTSVTLEKGPEHSCPGEETQPERPVGQAALSSSNASTEEELSERFHLCEVTQHVDDAARKAHEEEPKIAETQAESDRASVRSQPEVQAPLVSQPLDTSHIMEKEGHTGFKSVEHRRKLGSSRRTKGKQQDHKEDVETTWADEGSETTGTTRQEELTQHTDPAANASELMRRYGNEGETAEKTRKDDTAVPDSAMGPSVTGTTDVTEGEVLLPGVEGNKHTEVCHKLPPKDEQIMGNGATSAESVAATVENVDKPDSIREKEATSADGSYSESDHDSRTEEKVSDPINQDHHAFDEVNPDANDAESATTEGQEEDSVKGPAEQTGHLDKEAPPSVPDHRTLQPEILASADPHTQDNPGSSEEQNNKGFKSVGSRRKLGSSRRNDGKQRGENPESHQSPTEGRNTVRHEQLEASPGATQEAWDPPQAEAVHGPAEEQALVGWDGSTRPEGDQQLKDQSSLLAKPTQEMNPAESDRASVRSQPEVQAPLVSQPLDTSHIMEEESHTGFKSVEHRRKLGSSRRTKGKQRVLDTASDADHKEDVETTWADEGSETTDTTRQEELTQHTDPAANASELIRRYGNEGETAGKTWKDDTAVPDSAMGPSVTGTTDVTEGDVLLPGVEGNKDTEVCHKLPPKDEQIMGNGATSAESVAATVENVDKSDSIREKEATSADGSAAKHQVSYSESNHDSRTEEKVSDPINQDHHASYEVNPEANDAESATTEGQEEDSVKGPAELTGHLDKEAPPSVPDHRTLQPEILASADPHTQDNPGSSEEQNNKGFKSVGSRRKLGSSRRNDGKQRGENPESHQSPTEGRNTVRYEQLEASPGATQEAWDPPQAEAVHGPAEEQALVGWDGSTRPEGGQQLKDQSSSVMQIQDEEHPHVSVPDTGSRDTHEDLMRLKPEGRELQTSVTLEKGPEHSCPGEETQPERPVGQAALSSSNASTEEELSERFHLCEVTQHVDDAARKAHEEEPKIAETQAESDRASVRSQPEVQAPLVSQPLDTSHIMEKEGHTGFKSVEHRRKLGSSRRTKGKQQDHKEDVETTWADEGSETTGTTRQEELTQHTDPAANASELMRRYGNEGETAGKTRKDDTAVPDSAMGPSVTGTTDVTKGDVLLPGVEGNKHTEVCHKPPPKDEQIMSNGATSAESVAATVEDVDKSDSIREKEATSADGSYSESDHDSRTEEKVSDPINQDHHASYEVNPDANDAENATTEGQEEDSVKGPAEQTGHLDKEAPPSVPDHRTLQPEILASADPHTQDNPGSSEEQNNKGFKSVGSRRKLGSSRRNGGKQRGENPESHQSPTEGRNTVRYEQLEASPGATQEAWDPPQAEAVHGPAEEQALVGWDGSTRPEGDQQLKDQSSLLAKPTQEMNPAEYDRASVRSQPEVQAPLVSQPLDTSHIMEEESHTGFKSVEHRRKLGSSRRTKGKQRVLDTASDADHKEDVGTTWADDGSETTDTTRQEELTQHTDPAANASELIRRYGNEGETAGKTWKDDTAVPDSAMGPSVTGTTDVKSWSDKHEVLHKHIDDSEDLKFPVRKQQPSPSSQLLPPKTDPEAVRVTPGQVDVPGLGLGWEKEKPEEEQNNVQASVREPNAVKEDADNKNSERRNPSPNFSSTNRRRKMGSTRRNLGSNREHLDQKQEMDNDSPETAGDVGLGEKTAGTSWLQPHRGQGRDSAHKEVRGGSEHSHISEAQLNAVATQADDSLSRSEESKPEVEQEHLAAEPSPTQDVTSESPKGGRRRKFGSNRKSRGNPGNEDHTAREDRPTDAPREERGFTTSSGDDREESVALGKLAEKSNTQINGSDEKLSPNIRSAGESWRPGSEKGTKQVAPHAGIHLGQKNRGDLSLAGDSTETDVRATGYNVLMVGDTNVGKTSFMKRAQSGKFSPDLPSSVGLDSCMWTVVVDGKRVVLHLWDTAGQERFHSITRQIFHRAQAFLLVYDITSSKSFSAVSYWANCIQEGAAENVSVLLLGNKSDRAERQVNAQDGEMLAKEYNFDFMECSAATGENVMECLETMARTLTQRAGARPEAVELKQESQQRTRSGCC